MAQKQDCDNVGVVKWRSHQRGLAATSSGTQVARPKSGGRMSLVRLLGFTTLACGCVIGYYREVTSNREVAYVEEKGTTCEAHAHRRNHTVSAPRTATRTHAFPITRTA